MYRLALCVCVAAAVTVTVAVAVAGASGENQAAVSPQTGGKGPVVESPSGKFLGSWMRSRRGRRFQAYRGIKYAAAPVGALRFQPPRAVLHYPAAVDATADGPRCPQPLPAGRLVDEDCLMLNVYTPANNSSNPLPVIVYIHAGGFYSMTSRSDVVGPEYLLDRDLVLVTINYRLGSLGFLALGTKEAPGNNGFKDQVAALMWVQRNIAAFGGDPNLVTIAGCSAGSVSVMLHMISPMSKGLFHRAISISGSPTSKVPAPPHRLDLAEKQARISKCSADSPGAIYRCLQTKSWQEIAGSMLGFFEFGFDPLSLWRPVVEPDFGQQRFLTEDSMEAIRAGRMHAVPFIISQTRDEFYWKAFTVLRNATLLSIMNREWDRIAPISFILPRDDTTAVRRLKAAYFQDLPGLTLRDDEESADALGKLYGDAITGFPVHRMANLMCRHSKQPVWYYELEYRGQHSHYEEPTSQLPHVGMSNKAAWDNTETAPAASPSARVAHHDDLIYLFTLRYRQPPLEVADTDDSRMVDKMTAIWYNFARYGDPNPRIDTPEVRTLSWPAMTPEDRKYLQLSSTFTVHSRLFEERFKVWDEVYPIEY